MFKGVEPRSIEQLKELRRTYRERKQKEEEDAKALKVQRYLESMPQFYKEILEREILPQLELAFQAGVKMLGLTYYQMQSGKRFVDHYALAQTEEHFWHRFVFWMYAHPSKEAYAEAMNRFGELLLAIRDMWSAYYPDMHLLFEGDAKDVREFRLEEK